MFHNGSVPNGCFVDHIDGYNQNDRVENLQLMKIKESHQQGNGVQVDEALGELSWWFDMVGYWGYDPIEQCNEII
jgi:hypothetical protein